MKQVEGQALPPTVGDEGPDNSGYFQIQLWQLKSIAHHPLKTALVPKKLASSANVPFKTHPHDPHYPAHSRQLWSNKLKLTRLSSSLHKKPSKRWSERLEGKKYTIKQVDYKWRIVTSNTEDIGIKDNFLTSAKLLDWLQQLAYGQEEEKRAWARVWEDSNRHHDKLYNQLEGLNPSQRSQGSKPPVWQKPHSCIQEWKNCLSEWVVVNKRKIIQCRYHVVWKKSIQSTVSFSHERNWKWKGKKGNHRVAAPKKKRMKLRNWNHSLVKKTGWRQETETKSTERIRLELEPTRPVCTRTVNVDVVLTLKNGNWISFAQLPEYGTQHNEVWRSRHQLIGQEHQTTWHWCQPSQEEEEGVCHLTMISANQRGGWEGIPSCHDIKTKSSPTPSSSVHPPFANF